MTIGGTQLDLPFALGPAQRRQGAVRVWLTAGRGFNVARRHLFVDPETGASAFSPDDFVVFRQSSGRYALLGPRAFSTRGRQWLLGELLALAQRRVFAAAKSGKVRELLAVTFLGKRARNQLPSAEAAKTNLEHYLRQVCSANPATTVFACSKIESLYGRDLHPGLRGLIRRRFASQLRLVADPSEPELETDTIFPAYERALKDFASAGLWFHARRSVEDATLLLDGEQPSLPGLEATPMPIGDDLDFAASRLSAFPILIDAADAFGRSPPATSTVFRMLGEAPMDDAQVLRLLADEKSPRRRVAATVRRIDEHIRLVAGLHDELRLFLGEGPEAAPQTGVAAIRVSSDTLDFTPSQIAVLPENAATFTGQPDKSTSHKVRINITLLSGGSLSLEVNIPKSLQQERRFI